MFDDSKAWYSFALTDPTARVIVDSPGLPPECGGLLGGKPVDIDTAMCALEATGVINPGLCGHHVDRVTPSGPSPHVGRPCICVSDLRLAARHAAHIKPMLHELRGCAAQI